MRAGEVVHGDILRVTHPNWHDGEVTVLDVYGDKAVVFDRKRPGMRFQVGIEHLQPRVSAGDTGQGVRKGPDSVPRGARNAGGAAGDSRR